MSPSTFSININENKSNEIIDLIGSFGIYNGNTSEKSSNIFQPMKSQAKTLNEINIKNKIKNLYMNMTNISSVKNKLSSAPFHKILLCLAFHRIHYRFLNNFLLLIFNISKQIQYLRA